MSAKIIPIRPDVALGDGWIGPKPGDDGYVEPPKVRT